jgi:hypothetical protein
VVNADVWVANSWHARHLLREAQAFGVRRSAFGVRRSAFGVSCDVATWRRGEIAGAGAAAAANCGRLGCLVVGRAEGRARSSGANQN